MSLGFLALDQHLHLALFGPDDHRLLAHPAHHIEGTLRFASQGQLERVLLNAPLNDLPQLLGNRKEAVGGTEALQRLVRPLVVVMLHPQPDPLPRRLKTVELRSYQELFPDGFPESLDLAQRHGVMGPALDVMDPILAQLRLEARSSPPTGILASLIGEHLFGHARFGHRRAIDLQNVLGRLAAKDVRSHQVAGEIVHEPDEVGVLAAQAEGEDVGLPQLVGRRALKEARLGGIAPRFGLPLLQQLLLMQRAANCFPAHRQKQCPSQEVTDLLNAQIGMTTLKFDDFSLDRRRHLGPVADGTSGMGLEAGFALLAVNPHPLAQRAQAHAHFAGHLPDGKAFFQTKLNCFAPDFKGMTMNVLAAGSSRRPPRGAGSLPLPLYFLCAFHR
jgi:hypothetical protein